MRERDNDSQSVHFQMYTISFFIFTLPPINSWKEGKIVGAEEKEVKEGGCVADVHAQEPR